MSKITSRITRILSKSGRPYLAISVEKEDLNPYLEKLYSIEKERFLVLTKNQCDRDRGEFHVTVVDPREYKEIFEGQSKRIFYDLYKQSISYCFIGLGFANIDEKKSYFVIVESRDLLEIRKAFGLPEKDFHVTLGFSEVDLQGVRKDRTTLLR